MRATRVFVLQMGSIPSTKSRVWHQHEHQPLNLPICKNRACRSWSEPHGHTFASSASDLLLPAFLILLHCLLLCPQGFGSATGAPDGEAPEFPPRGGAGEAEEVGGGDRECSLYLPLPPPLYFLPPRSPYDCRRSVYRGGQFTGGTTAVLFCGGDSMKAPKRGMIGGYPGRKEAQQERFEELA